MTALYHFIGLSRPPSIFSTGIYPILEVVGVCSVDLVHHGKTISMVHVISVL